MRSLLPSWYMLLTWFLAFTIVSSFNWFQMLLPEHHLFGQYCHTFLHQVFLQFMKDMLAMLFAHGVVFCIQLLQLLQCIQWNHCPHKRQTPVSCTKTIKYSSCTVAFERFCAFVLHQPLCLKGWAEGDAIVLVRISCWVFWQLCVHILSSVGSSCGTSWPTLNTKIYPCLIHCMCWRKRLRCMAFIPSSGEPDLLLAILTVLVGCLLQFHVILRWLCRSQDVLSWSTK